MEFRKKLGLVKGLLGRGDDDSPGNPIQQMLQRPEDYRLEAYLEDGELGVKVKPKERAADILPKPEGRKIIGYRLRSHN